MKMKRTVLLAVLAVALAALVVPMVGLRASASSPAGPAPSAAKSATPAPSPVLSPAQRGRGQEVLPVSGEVSDFGQIGNDTLSSLALPILRSGVKPSDVSRKIAAKLKGGKRSAALTPQAGEPGILSPLGALSAGAVMTNIGGRDNQFSEVALYADWDGREDCAADRSHKVDDFSFVEPDIDFELTKTAISEHTYANGFTENVYYYGDSVGNVWVGVDTDGAGDSVNDVGVELILQLNLPTILNAFGSLNSDDQIIVTGLAVNPVADLTSFSNVNGAFAPFAGQTGEVLYVSFFDAQGGLRLASNNTLVRSGVLAFPISDLVSPAQALPGVQSDTGFPITVGGAFGVVFSVFANVAGLTADDDGSVYFHQVDLIQFTGSNIVKIASLDSALFQDRSLAVSGILTITTLNPTGRVYGTTSGPATQVNRFTNYSGTASTFGNVVAIDAGACNVLYAAVAKSNTGATGSPAEITEGLFANPSALGATPSMIISFADCAGAFDVCSAIAGFGGQIPVANGLADVAGAGLSDTPGVNNFRVFVLGNGPAIAAAVPAAVVTPGTLKLDMQIDATMKAGIAVDENGTVYVISGGTQAGIGRNPSPNTGEILCFEDMCPMDRRADFVDLRGNVLPNPPLSGGNVGDGDSDRFDHIFQIAPLDGITLTPAGLSGLAVGFLRYTNRLADNEIGPLVPLGLTTTGKGVQGDDDTDGPIIFEAFDPSHQVAGGDDQNTPFRGDDSNGLGSPVLVGPLSGGFEFVFGGPVGVAGCVWNGFWLNSNGNITFGAGDTDNTPDILDFRAGLPKIAGAWADLNPASRSVAPGTFPVQALGFSGINAFKIRYINVPEFGLELCAAAASGLSNTFAITLFDDGTGIDENASQPLNPANPIGNNAVPFDLQEGPTDLRWTLEPNTQTLVGCSPRRQGSGSFLFEYCRMDLLGTAARPVITGYSIGGLNPLNPPGLCETNLSEAARAADTSPFGVIQGQTASICPCLIGEGTEPTLFELFNEGSDPTTGSGGEVTLATPDFDLRFEGNDAALCTPSRQRDLNRGKVGLFGIGCMPPSNPLCQIVVPGPFVVAPDQPTRLIDALCDVQLNMVGCDFFPNETTIICQGFVSQTGVPLQRPGKTVSSAMSLVCDTNGDSVPDATIALTNVTPVSKNLVRGTLASLVGQGLPGTAFPLTCCGGVATVTTTTTFSAGDNNVFGPFTRTATCSLNLGLRAPVVISASPSDGNCAVGQDILIPGACFIINGVPNVTRVFAVERNNANNVVNATRFALVNPNLLDAFFEFGTVNAGKTFLIFVSGPNGTSRNLTALPAGAPAGCPLGNEQGIQVTFTCSSSTTPASDAPVITSVELQRTSTGGWQMNVNGSNFLDGMTATIGGSRVKKVKLRGDVLPGSNARGRAKLKGGFCSNLPGSLVLTNPGTGNRSSQPFQITGTCN